jgi:hypothetical protein
VLEEIGGMGRFWVRAGWRRKERGEIKSER